MSELKITSEVLAPESSISFTISGNHPSRFLSMMPDLLKGVFKIDSSAVYEDELRWSAYENEKYYFWGRWRGKVAKDARTTEWVEVKMQGEQNVKDNFGTVTVKIKGVMTSTWKFSSAIDKALGLLYLKNIYADQRRRYNEEVKRDMERLADILRGRMEIIEKRN